MFRICYCEELQKSKIGHYRQICTQFVEATKEYMPQYSRRLKVHLLLHLVDSMTEFGATACYSTERLIGLPNVNDCHSDSFFRGLYNLQIPEYDMD